MNKLQKLKNVLVEQMLTNLAQKNALKSFKKNYAPFNTQGFANSLLPHVIQKFSVDQLVQIALPIAWAFIIIIHHTFQSLHLNSLSLLFYLQEEINPQGEDGGYSQSSF